MAPWRLSRHFLGRPASVTEARRFITGTLGAWPVVEQAELIVSELATNAVRHTASARFGGKFIVSIQAEPDQVWLGVADEGGPGLPRLVRPSDDEGGRGLLLVASLADNWGVYGNQAGRTVWALLKVDPIAAAAQATCR
ncbi:ATP-binding protein [Microbispora hainanensis]|uniref:ATP-binding protein n=1 Tax=Microbispora hainanensis TaxID=568844 RepID=A0A544YW80_9ACTN|nr:ATP-binding protein [Microbispora hainanensis]TQS21019.1 ATP-binding protein [Microbispora hainanensis]